VLGKRSPAVDQLGYLGLPSPRRCALEVFRRAGVVGRRDFCSPSFFESKQGLNAFRNASAQRALKPALGWGRSALINRCRSPAPMAILPKRSGLRCAPVGSDAFHEPSEVKLVPSVVSTVSEPSANYSAVNIKQNENERAVDVVRHRSTSRLVKARTGEETQQRTQVCNISTSDVERLSSCHRNIRREHNIRSISQRCPPAINSTFSISFVLVKLKREYQFAVLKCNNGRPGLLEYRGEKRYCRFKRSIVELLLGRGEAATAPRPIRFAKLSSLLPTPNRRACNG
jgi:hypothetical protein